MAGSGAEPPPGSRAAAAGARLTPAHASAVEARYQRALAASHDGFWERNLRTQAIWYSPSFLSLFGFADGDLPARRGVATARVHPEDRARFVAAYDNALANRATGSFNYEIRFLDASGQWRWVRGQGQVWSDEQGEPEFICGAVSDIHHKATALLQLKQQRAELEALVQERTAGLEAALILAEQRRIEAERANAAKTQFLAHMSHEIRTPLNGVLGLTELALRGAISTDQRRYLTVAHQSGQALLRVISDVLDFSRIEAGRVDLRPQSLDLPALLAEALRAVMPLARQRDLVLMYDWTGDSDLVLGDETGIRQIITNLLGNAIKFTRQGQVSLTTDARRDGPAHLALAIQVQDSGPGIPPALLGRIFEPFEQGDDSLGRSHGGTGLGLAIAYRLAAAMGGAMQVECPAEGGTIFTLALRLPLANPDIVAAAPTAAVLTGRQAWLVYHREAPALWLAGRLERLGWQVIPCIGLPDAMGRALDAAEPRPDLVLLAEPALSPGIDLRPLRTALPGTLMHLLIRPDWHDPALELQTTALGVSTMVAPLTPSDLLGLGKDLDATPAPAPAPFLPGDSADGPPTDAVQQLRVGASVLLVEDNPVNQMVGQAFLQALGLRVKVADGGSEALASCQDDPPDLVLMDLQMPGMDGLEATQRLLALQREGRWPGAPIVALTAHASETDRHACLAAGMVGVLTKPLSLDGLRRQLLPWLAQ